jgi:crossover junction endodeoxyribonuclease RuvC
MIIGIDPGMSGGIAFAVFNKQIAGYEMPTLELTGKGKTRRRLDPSKINRLFDQYIVTGEYVHAFIEKAQSMPGQGVASVFGYGMSYGIILGILDTRKIPFTEVTPQAWKKVMLASMDKSSKDASRLRAKQLFPDTLIFDRKKDEHVAEAALIAEYGRRTLAPTSREE